MMDAFLDFCLVSVILVSRCLEYRSNVGRGGSLIARGHQEESAVRSEGVSAGQRSALSAMIA